MLCPFTVLGVIRAVMGLLFAACGFVSWSSQLQSLAGWSSGIITSVLGLMALAALTIIVRARPDRCHEQGAARLCAQLPDLHAQLRADFLPGHLRQSPVEAHRT